MNYKHFIGIDVSKSWLDFTVLDGPTLVFHQRTSNSLEGIKDFYKALRKQKTYHKGSALFCMEHTGIYNNHLLQFLSNNGLNVCLESGIQIKQSSGLKRGKNDKVDSLRIATYAFKNQHELRLWKPKREVVVQLKHFTTLRARLVNVLRQLRTPIKEALDFTDKGAAKLSIQMCKSSIKSLEGI